MTEIAPVTQMGTMYSSSLDLDKHHKDETMTFIMTNRTIIMVIINSKLSIIISKLSTISSKCTPPPHPPQGQRADLAT